MISPKTAYRVSLVAGLLVLLLSAVGASLTPVRTCGGLASNYPPIIAFELARSVKDLHAIFGEGASECRTAITAALDRTDWIDSLLYIPIYGSFLAFFFLGMRVSEKRLAMLAVGIVIASCAMDYAENLSLFNLSANPDRASIWLSALAWTTECKWVGLGVAGAIGGVILAKRGGAWRVAVIPCSMGLIAAVISIPAPAISGPYLSIAFALGWMMFLVVSALEAFPPSASQKTNND